ncbi:diguanylate cyclase domain-containing protein [Quadrisphaera setariae]|uniref:Diguanylate cyclase n=1 Tax=Quadrisphaera setariae TaxID=2593304 RepID=A0A5C8ZE56_9ACTN|nr:diguanylate cyclase [Quadrisphaera setariae]TXR55579.1 diguanylate cyclase [Quadrisphaera setariae]
MGGRTTWRPGFDERTLAVLGVVGAVAFVVLAGPVGSIAWSGVPYSAVGLFCCVATVVGIRRHRPRHATAWWLIAASHAVWSAADTVYYLLAAFGDLTFPTSADWLYVLGYLPLVVGAALLVRRARPHGQLGAVVDGAVVATGLLLVGWMLFVGPVVSSRGEDLLGHLVGGFYLGADVLLVALAAHLVASSVRLSRSSWLALAAIALLLVGDATYVFGSVLPGWAFTAMSLGWLLSNVAWSAAALHPSMVDLSDREAPAATGMTPRRSGVLLVAVLLAPATLAAEQVLDLEFDWAVATASAVMSVLVVLRMGMALRAASASLLAREEMRRALEHQAGQDALTGLANRSASTEHLARALAGARERRTAVGLLFVDLDGFKAVNDVHGHRAGDDVLREVAVRLSGTVRDGDRAGRLGGDEFVLVLTAVDDVDDVLAVAQRVVDGVAEPIVADGHVVVIGASVGAAVAGALSDAEELLHEADTAAYRAKALGRGRVELYDGVLRDADTARAAAEAELRERWPVTGLALDLHPVLTAAPGAPTTSASLRWTRGEGAQVDHAVLTAAAERTGRGRALGLWTLDEGLRQRGGSPVWLPLSPSHAASPTVLDDVAAALAAHGTAAEHLGVRTCGRSALASEAAVANLRALRRTGVRVVLKNLTAQATGLGQLSELPADVLLLRSDDLPGAAVLDLFVRGARTLGLDVVLDGPPRDDRADRLELADVVRALGVPVIGEAATTGTAVT